MIVRVCSIVYSDVLVTNARACANVPLNLLTSNIKRKNARPEIEKGNKTCVLG